jgi:hypothetical protein
MHTKIRGASKKVLMIVIALAIIVGTTVINAPKAYAHTTYTGQRFGQTLDSNGEMHYYVELDIYYTEDWDIAPNDWTISPKVLLQTLKPWGSARSYGGKLRVGIPSIDSQWGLIIPPGLVASQFTARPKN